MRRKLVKKHSYEKHKSSHNSDQSLSVVATIYKRFIENIRDKISEKLPKHVRYMGIGN